MARLTDMTKMVKMRKALEDLMLQMTVEEFKNFILQNAVVEEDADEFAQFIPKGEHKFVKGKTYILDQKDFQGGSREFIITEDGRVFLSYTLLENVEVEESPEMIQEQPEEIDFRQHKDIIKEAVAKVNSELPRRLHWSVKILKKSIRLTNQYIKGEYDKDFFEIKSNVIKTDDDTTISLKVYDCIEDEAFTFYLVDEPDYKWDGSFETCIRQAVRSADTYFTERY